ncbi:plastid-lipid-associated protein, chloroplastic-like [Punica granatum]|uniref:Plastid-lipid-associated protein, chloroplastic-like n=2 Tax=Punica granatum TaxID=22663 RepID=A0A6P8D9Y4_PUNGR|nr:plastid-lipid-associated protein, chloroplastic-like [Punica granatum]
MSTISQFLHLPYKVVPPSASNPKFTSKPAILPLNPHPVRALGKDTNKVRPAFVVRASEYEDEWGPEKGQEAPEVDAGGVAVAEEPKEAPEITSLKKALVDSFYGTNLGLSATSETRAEIVELITQLEAKNPTPAPTEALTLLNGKWILAYTSFVGLFPLLARGTLPLVKVEEISQIIDSENFTVQNSVQFSGPLATTSFSTNAKFEVRSPKRVQIKFEEGIIGTPQLTDSIELPENVEFLGQKIDLTPFKGLITSVQGTASSVVKTISNQPPLKFSLARTNAESWLLTTYLDEDIRISRGDGGSIFVLLKEGSSFLLP